MEKLFKKHPKHTLNGNLEKIDNKLYFIENDEKEKASQKKSIFVLNLENLQWKKNEINICENDHFFFNFNPIGFIFINQKVQKVEEKIKIFDYLNFENIPLLVEKTFEINFDIEFVFNFDKLIVFFGKNSNQFRFYSTKIKKIKNKNISKKIDTSLNLKNVKNDNLLVKTNQNKHEIIIKLNKLTIHDFLKKEIIFEKQKKVELLKEKFVYHQQIQTMNYENDIRINSKKVFFEEIQKKRKNLSYDLELNLELISLENMKEDILIKKNKILQHYFQKFMNFPNQMQYLFETINNNLTSDVELKKNISKKLIFDKSLFVDSKKKLEYYLERYRQFKEQVFIEKRQFDEITIDLKQLILEKYPQYDLFQNKSEFNT